MMEEKMNCDKCGKNMESERGASTIGMMIQIYPDDPARGKEFMAKQLGKYAGKLQFIFCYECLIDAIMGAK